MEGKPGVELITNYFEHDAVSAAEDNGMPGLRYVKLPDSWYRARIDPEMCKTMAESVLDEVIDALTRPLTAAEETPVQKEKETPSETYTVSGTDYNDALEALHALFLQEKLSDGLPIVPPTREAVDWMLTGTSMPADKVIGVFPPKFGTATVEKIAINAVMAGAKPEYMPVIIAALKGMSDPGFDAIWWRMSTSSSLPVIVASGPITDEINMNCGMGLYGYGYRANATIGRAIQLTTMNAGHTWPSENDMAANGRYNSFTFYVMAENRGESPWESFAEEKGYGPDGNVVMVSVAPGGRTYNLGGGAVSPWSEQTILDKAVDLMKGIFAVSNVWASVYTLVMHPECAKRLADKGWSKRDVQNYLYEKSRIPYEELDTTKAKEEDLFRTPYTKEQLILENIKKGLFAEEAIPVFREALKPGGKVPVVQAPDHINIIVAGGKAGYSFLFGGVNPNYNHAITPVTGALLTVHGR